MHQLSSAGRQAVADIARRHGFSVDATLNMLDAVLRGNGSMAQFDHPEFSGAGQWMRGGMTMVSNLFDNQLKSRVDALCSELANLVAGQPGLLQSGSFQSQSQGVPAPVLQASPGGALPGGAADASSSLFVPPSPGTSSDWWGADLGRPASSGSQNGMRYAYFPQSRRLAVDAGSGVTVYDTLDHQIGGVSQQQSGSGTLSFTSQHGPVQLSSLPVVSPSGAAASPPAPAPGPSAAPFVPAPSAAPAPAASSPSGGQDVFATIERLAQLKDKGILTEEEFAAKKADLLGRL